MNNRRQAVLGVAIAAAALASPALNAAEHATITLYHHISDSTPDSTSVPPQRFREQMQYLQEGGYHIMALPELLEAMHQRQSVPDKTVAITFDDGYISIYDTAFPMLQEFGFPFTVFVNTQPINDELNGYMSWEQVREMSDAGVTIANHMVNHPYMINPVNGEDDATRIARLRDELQQSQQEIARHTGQDHKFMAYPYGEYDMAIKQMIADEGFMGLGQQSGAIGYDADFLALPRFPFGGNYTDMNDFRQKVQTLSFHVTQVDPESPVTASRNPQVTLQLAPGNFNFRQLGCYANGQAMQMEWLDQEAGLVRLSTDQEFTSRRFRYLCTAPDRDLNGRFYWYSKDWINPR